MGPLRLSSPSSCDLGVLTIVTDMKHTSDVYRNQDKSNLIITILDTLSADFR